MNKGRIAALMAATLVAGIVAGNVASGWAATTRPNEQATAPASAGCGTGVRLGAAVRDAGGRLVDSVAKLTGMKVDEVAARRAEGESLSAIADSKGVSSEEVVTETLAVRRELLDGKVKAGALTQDEADAALERMEIRLTERVESTQESCTGAGTGIRGGGQGGMRGGAGGCGGGGGGRCGQTPSQ